MAVLSSLIDRLCLVAAILGGLVICCLAIVVSVSAIMRELGYGGVLGINELIQIACCLSAFLFLPLCQYQGGHVTVDLFSNALPQKLQKGLERFWHLVFALSWTALAWRMLIGGLDKYEFLDKTSNIEIDWWLLQIDAPIQIWTVYIFAVFGTTLSALIAFLHTFSGEDHHKTSTEGTL